MTANNEEDKADPADIARAALPVTMRSFSAQDAPSGKPADAGSSRWAIKATARGS
ncbi:hypothetical protein [Streptomyces sp. NPDC001165]|uniref:hypothetical protein n=1 Tax=Streptomyces sp. NPDC001165 TaxID=3364546 RepID=UPI00368DC6E5